MAKLIPRLPQCAVAVMLFLLLVIMAFNHVPKMENAMSTMETREPMHATLQEILTTLQENGIDKSGAWRGKSFHHMTDDNFGTALITLLKELKISSVTDLGCGTGDYVKRIAGSAISVQGFDSNPVTAELDVSGGLCVGPVDLTKKKIWNMTDAAMSIEVAEQIPAQFEDKFVDNLVGSARDLVILSWAVPGQGGEGHVNGKMAVAVNQKMKERGWEKNEEFMSQLQLSATLPRKRANVQVFTKRKK